MRWGSFARPLVACVSCRSATYDSDFCSCLSRVTWAGATFHTNPVCLGHVLHYYRRSSSWSSRLTRHPYHHFYQKICHHYQYRLPLLPSCQPLKRAWHHLVWNRCCSTWIWPLESPFSLYQWKHFSRWLGSAALSIARLMKHAFACYPVFCWQWALTGTSGYARVRPSTMFS